MRTTIEPVPTPPAKKQTKFVKVETEKSSVLKQWDGPMPVLKMVSTDPNITKIDPAYQRPSNEKKISKIANNFEIEFFIPPVINARRSKNGKIEYFNMDGQHRQLAARKAGYAEMPALFFDIGGQSDEALLFVRTNRDRTAVSRKSQFNALLTGNDPVAKGIEAIFKKYGIQPRNQGRGASEPFQFAALEQVTSLFVLDPVVFDFTFRTLINAYSGNNFSLRRRILVGTFNFIKMYQFNNGFDFIRLEKAMAECGAQNLWIWTQAEHSDNYQKVLATLLKIYNNTDGPRLKKSHAFSE